LTLLLVWVRRTGERRKSWRTHSGKAWRQRQQCQGGSKAGAVGYVLKRSAGDDLIHAIRRGKSDRAGT